MNSLGLYLHVPFCKKKCAYCDFYSTPNTALVGAFEEALCRALAGFSEKAREHRVETVYFGGGTPSLLSPEGLERIMGQVRACYTLSPEAEITLEMNPESVTESFLEACGKSGVNRVSLGMQSAKDSELALLGRLHRFDAVVRAVDLVRSAGIDNLSLDLMYGLPRQTPSDFAESLEQAIALSPDHISFYLLTLSREVPLYEKRNLLPDDEAVRAMYLSAVSTLEKNGFEQYEISNAARAGKASRHNRIYWMGGEYLGIGPGAHSYFLGERFSMTADTASFISASKACDTVEESYFPDETDRRTEYLMLSLRTVEGVDLARLSSLSDDAFCRKAEKKFSLWARHGLCRKTEKGYALTPEGFFVSNEIITELI